MKKHFQPSFEELSCHNNSCLASKLRFACLLNTLEREKTLEIADTSFFHKDHDVDKTLLTFAAIQWKFLVVFAFGWFVATVIFLASTTRFVLMRSGKKEDLAAEL